MNTSKTRSAKRFLSVTFFLLLPIQYVFSAPLGSVNYAIEWGHPSRVSYTYVFSGIVTCGNRPCSKARVDLDLATASRGIVYKSTVAGEDGRFQIQITVAGASEESSTWKLQARRSGIAEQVSGEAQGRVILLETQTTVVVNRSLPLVQA